MEEKRSSPLLNILSVLYVAGAVYLLFLVCTHCYPQTEEYLRQALAGLEDSPVRAAFSVLTEGLQQGQPVVECLTDSCEVLFSEI